MTLLSYSVAIRALLIQANATGGATPFFTNDFVGLIKIVLVFGSMIGTMIALVVRLSTGKFRDDVRDTQADVTALGKKVDNMAKDFAAEQKQSETVRIEVKQHATEIGNIREAQGEVRAGLEALRSANVELQRDITSAITESGARLADQITLIRVEVARLQERDRLADQIGRIVNGGKTL